jgi:hypothetical protein
MRALDRVRHSLRALFARERVERELDEELRLHLELEAEQRQRAGAPADEARRGAAVSFGGIERVKEECRDSWGVRFLETVFQDLRYGARTLRRNPGFTAVVAVTLGLGIGANTAVFSVVSGVLLRPLPYARGQEVVALHQPAPRADIQDIGFSVKEVADYAGAPSLEDVVEYHSMNFTLLGGREPQRVRTGVVSARFFRVLGVEPVLGRTFRDDEDARGAEPVLVLSHSYWQEKLGGDPGIVGRTFEMNDRVHTVVGVLPALPGYPDENDVYMPASACPFRTRPAVLEDRQVRGYQAFARVREGVPLEQAAADVATIARRLRAAYPDAYPNGLGRRWFPCARRWCRPPGPPSSCCWPRWRSCCSSPAPTSRTSPWPGSRSAGASWASGPRWARDARACCASSSPRAPCSRSSAGCSAWGWRS